MNKKQGTARQHLTAPINARGLELGPEQLVGDFVMELNLWDFDDRPERFGAAVGLHQFEFSKLGLYLWR